MPSLIEIGPVVLEKKIFKFRQCNFPVPQLSPLGKGRGPSFEQTWIPFTQGCFVPSLVEIGPVVLEKKMKMWKVYDNDDNDNNNDDGQRTNLTWAFGSGELKKQWGTISYTHYAMAKTAYFKIKLSTERFNKEKICIFISAIWLKRNLLICSLGLLHKKGLREPIKGPDFNVIVWYSCFGSNT